MAIVHLLYRSYSAGDIKPATLAKILEVSRINNERDQITGLLLYRSRMFMQLLEGDEHDVQKCLTRIRQDARHYGAGIILKVTSSARLFPHWSMGTIPTESVRPFRNVEAVTEALGRDQKPSKQTVLQIIKSFAEIETAQNEESA